MFPASVWRRNGTPLCGMSLRTEACSRNIRKSKAENATRTGRSSWPHWGTARKRARRWLSQSSIALAGTSHSSRSSSKATCNSSVATILMPPRRCFASWPSLRSTSASRSRAYQAALAAAKARGVKLGNPRYQESTARALAAKGYRHVPPEVEALITGWRDKDDETLQSIADRLNALNIRTPQASSGIRAACARR